LKGFLNFPNCFCYYIYAWAELTKLIGPPSAQKTWIFYFFFGLDSTVKCSGQERNFLEKKGEKTHLTRGGERLEALLVLQGRLCMVAGGGGIAGGGEKEGESMADGGE